MFKRIIAIITLVAILASFLCFSAGAAGTVQGSVEATFYKNNIMGTDIALYGANGNWFRYQYDEEGLSPMVQEMYTSRLEWGTYAGYAADVLEGFGYIQASVVMELGSFLAKYEFASFDQAAQRFTLRIDEGLGAYSYAVYSVMGMSNNTHNNVTKLQVFEAVGGLQDIRHVWYDNTPVDFKSLQACCQFLQHQGFLCQVIRIPYYVVLGEDTYRYGEMHCIAFYGDLSGGFSYDVSNYKVTGDWYILGDNNGSYFGAVYGEVVTGDDSKVNDVLSPDSSLETDGRDYEDPETNEPINQPMISWDGDNFVFNDFSNDTSIAIGAYLYNPSLYKYEFYSVDNSTTINITYNIDYTQVTYIGASEEYEAYEYYYRLPDGRSSADMTAEDLEQLNLNYDVMNYGKAADDGRLRSLYHLDGNTEDASYWVNDTSFTWKTNPSIEYLEATNFEGCLYLDEQDHAFELKLPSRLSASDFTLQFRYYHYGYGDTENNTATNYTDLVVQSVDSTTQNAYSTLFTNLAGTLTTNSTTPIGQWSEVAVIRDGAILYTYVNGVVISSKAFVDVLGDTLVFDFKDVAVRRMIDEIRVFNYAMYEAGESYTPITVPMDTNLVLILPDEAVPLPDAYWDFNTDGNLLTYQDFTQGETYPIYNISAGTPQYFNYTTTAPLFSSVQALAMPVGSDKTDMNYVVYSDYLHLQTYSLESDNYYKFPLPNVSRFQQSASPYGWYSGSGAVVPLTFKSNRGAFENVSGLVAGTEYSFTLVLSDGSQFSHSFTYQGASLQSGFTAQEMYLYYSYTDFEWGRLLYQWNGMNGSSGYNANVVCIQPLRDLDIVYMELKEGEPNDQSDAYKTVIYNESDIEPNTIAVRSTVPVRSWRIGGVRPTLPYKGDVWFNIQGSRITSTQIYNGYMWVEVDCRIWTGERWAWPNYFDILTQQDMTDIKGTTDNVYIQDTDGYYSWITEQWKSLLDLLNQIVDLLSQLDSGGDVNINLDFGYDGDITIEFNTATERGRNALFEFLQKFWDVLFEPAFDGISSGIDPFISLFDPNTTTIVIDGETIYTPGGIVGKEYDFEA